MSRVRRSLFARVLSAWVAAVSAGNAFSALGQPAPPAATTAPKTLPVSSPATAPPTAAATVAAKPVPGRSLAHARQHRQAAGAASARAANAAARSYPASGDYINSTLVYDYEPGRLYEIQTSPHFLTAIMLRPGEHLLAKAAGDTVRWVLGETAQGSGPDQQAIVLIKPMRGGLKTNIVLTTDQRTYLVESSSHEGSTYTSAVRWNYPQEQMQALAAAQAAAAAAQAQRASVVVAPSLSIDELHFGYRIEPLRGRPPRWQPLRVFDDGTKTYIQFPLNMAATDAPPLFLLGPHGSAELVNYRFVNGYYVVDQLIDVAELRLGEKPQTVVRITRTGDRG